MSREQNRFNAMIKVLLVLLFIYFIVNLFVRPTCSEERDISFYWNTTREVASEKINTYIMGHYVTCNPKKHQGRLCIRALSLVPTVLNVCAKEDTNPYLISAMITLESNWDRRVMETTTGAYGLMQTSNHWRNVFDGGRYELDPEAQILNGIEILKIGYRKCASVRGALAYYAAGKDCIPFSVSDARYNLARKIEAL